MIKQQDMTSSTTKTQLQMQAFMRVLERLPPERGPGKGSISPGSIYQVET